MELIKVYLVFKNGFDLRYEQVAYRCEEYDANRKLRISCYWIQVNSKYQLIGQFNSRMHVFISHLRPSPEFSGIMIELTTILFHKLEFIGLL